GLENRFWDKSKCLEATQALQEINESTLGRVLQRVKEKSQVSAELETALREGLKIRNRLFHSFYRDHDMRIQTDEGRDLMMADLEDMHQKLFHAYQLAGAMSSLALRIVLEMKAEDAA
ncbi:MAG TPA: hypothetical protein VMA13_07295, partial [Candidatus Saccharimonadales bacterium]|nr:hypothetical protein [Candidatus Saccharimonadales bacterium]